MASSRKEKRQARKKSNRDSEVRRQRGPDRHGTSHGDNAAVSAVDGDSMPPGSPLALRPDTLAALDSGTLFRIPKSEIIDSAYEETVRYEERVLGKYKNGTDGVYGEVNQPLIDDIIDQTKITSESLFVDLGSGYGNVVLKVGLDTGCEAKGIELRPELFPIAQSFQKEVEKQAEAALLPCGRCTLLEGSFLVSEEVDTWIKEADVIFVNNPKFAPATNLKLVEKLHEMKKGAKLVFLGDWIEILTDDDRFDHKEHAFKEGGVSWTPNGGKYYIARVKKDQEDTDQDREARVKHRRNPRRRLSSSG